MPVWYACDLTLSPPREIRNGRSVNFGSQSCDLAYRGQIKGVIISRLFIEIARAWLGGAPWGEEVFKWHSTAR